MVDGISLLTDAETIHRMTTVALVLTAALVQFGVKPCSEEASFKMQRSVKYSVALTTNSDKDVDSVFVD